MARAQIHKTNFGMGGGTDVQNHAGYYPVRIARLSAMSYGTGMIPADAILGTTPKAGMPEAVETIYVHHANGGRSEIALKSYDQGVESFYGTGKDLVWLDEEAERGDLCRMPHAHALDRAGRAEGLSSVHVHPALGNDGNRAGISEGRGRKTKVVISATWDDVPHLTAEAKAELFASIPAYQRDARTKGIPQLGSGAIYQIADSDILVKPFSIPSTGREATAWTSAGIARRLSGARRIWNRACCISTQSTTGP